MKRDTTGPSSAAGRRPDRSAPAAMRAATTRATRRRRSGRRDAASSTTAPAWPSWPRPAPSRSASSSTSPASASSRAGSGHPDRLRPGDRARSSPRSWASRPTTSSGSRPISANREPFLQNGTVDFVIASYSITDERRQVVGQAGPYYVTGQSLLVAQGRRRDQGPEGPEGQEGLLRHRIDVDRDGREGVRRHAGRLRHVLRVRRPAQERVGRRGHHRRCDPARLRRRGSRRAQGRRQAVLRGALRHRLQARTTPSCASSSTRRSRRVRGRLVGEGLRRHARQVRQRGAASHPSSIPARADTSTVVPGAAPRDGRGTTEPSRLRSGGAPWTGC